MGVKFRALKVLGSVIFFFLPIFNLKSAVETLFLNMDIVLLGKTLFQPIYESFFTTLISTQLSLLKKTLVEK